MLCHTNVEQNLRRMAVVCCLVFCGNEDLLADVFHMPDGLKSLETVVVGEPGNAADDTGYGAVSYPFKIGRFEVTTAQYVEFLNAVATVDDLYELRNNDTEDPGACGVRRIGGKGNYKYEVSLEFANRPVAHVSFWDACRFANWLHNGQGHADTETGAYTLNGFKGADGRRIVRNPNARWFVPSEDEWYKAAYFDPAKAGGPGYWDYPTRSDSRGDRDLTGRHGNNSYNGSFLEPKYFTTEVGTFRNSHNAYGLFDSAGNVLEWNEALIAPLMRGFRGGCYATSDQGLNLRTASNEIGIQGEKPYLGFRMAGVVNETTSFPKPQLSLVHDIAADGSESSFARRPWRHPQTGKPFFPMGWYTWGCDAADLQQMAREGANTVLFTQSPTDVDQGEKEFESNLASMIDFLNEAEKVDIKVIMQCGWHSCFRDHDQVCIERVRKYVQAVCQHPALLAYQTYDEPEYKHEGGLNEFGLQVQNTFIGGLTKTRDAIRVWDPNRNHPVQVVFNLVPLSSYESFFPAIDGFQIDRYPIWAGFGFMDHTGDWGPLMMAWSISHGAAAVRNTGHLNPVPVMQGVGLSHDEGGGGGGYWWRNPTYEETRYMAWSSVTAGGWGFLHWIRNSSCNEIKRNVARLQGEFRELLPALEQSYENPPFTVSHSHTALTRSFLTDRVPDLTTLTLEDDANYYLVAADNSGNYDDVMFRMKLPHMQAGANSRRARVLNEDWSRPITLDPTTGEWQIPRHNMCFGDINIWVIPKATP